MRVLLLTVFLSHWLLGGVERQIQVPSRESEGIAPYVQLAPHIPRLTDDIPVNVLTHVNYAFAYIDPKTFEITTMDASVPSSTIDDVADLKKYKPSLEIFLSLGGWTFSDNDTATQPVFGNIARSSTNRKTFAQILLKFLNAYGFDGVDVDW